MGTSYLGAAMKGIGDGGTVLSRTMIEEQARQDRWNEQLRNQRELEMLKQQGRLEMVEARQAGGGGGGGSRGSRGGGGVMDLSGGQGEEMLAAQMGMSVPDYRKFVEMERTGSDKAYRTDFTTMDDEFGAMKGSALPPDFEEFKKQKRAQRGKLMETYKFSDDTDKIAKGRQTDIESGLIEKAAGGDRGAVEGILASKGKDPRETDAKAKKAEAEAKDEEASAALRARTDPNARKTGGGGGGGRSGDPELGRLKAAQVSLDRSVASVDNQERALRSSIKDMSRTQRQAAEEELKALGEQRRALTSQKSSLLDKIVKLESAAPSGAATPSAAPTTALSGVAAPKTQAEFDALPRGAKFVNPKDGKTYTKK
ncbi:MAG: hypothetical protein RL299_206 [Pseudomonadota bacterium]